MTSVSKALLCGLWMGHDLLASVLPLFHALHGNEQSSEEPFPAASSPTG